MTDARIGYGTQFLVGDLASPTVYTAVAEVTNVTPPPLTRDIIDATHMQSPGGWREFIAGLKDGGECSIEMNFIPGGPGQDLMIAMQVSPYVFPIRIVFPNGNTWDFEAYCTGFTPDVPVDDKMSATATFKVSGEPQFAA